ncbi:MAG TPA: tetraacyldisaccharide 4'-kinase [Vicinamibacterales bacterium]
MILQVLSAAYGAGASWRRRWYAARPSRRRRLARPVISVGNLTVGGSGKTPVVETIARMLLAEGERPVILTRGYARPRPRRGVTVVSDPSRIVAGYQDAGDEPLMLARALPGVPVLVGADRGESGRFAEERFDATVHLLDDGFQHLTLERDVDLLLADVDVLAERVLPAGRLREPIEAAKFADAVLVTKVRLTPDATSEVAEKLGINTAFTVTRTLGDPPGIGKDQQVFAVAGVARPERFFDDLRAAGWRVAGTLSFPDHHRFTLSDVDRIRAGAKTAGAPVLLTTAKDAVRLDTLDAGGVTFAAVPLTARVEPVERFREWLMAKLRRAR